MQTSNLVPQQLDKILGGTLLLSSQQLLRTSKQNDLALKPRDIMNLSLSPLPIPGLSFFAQQKSSPALTWQVRIVHTASPSKSTKPFLVDILQRTFALHRLHPSCSRPADLLAPGFGAALERSGSRQVYHTTQVGLPLISEQRHPCLEFGPGKSGPLRDGDVPCFPRTARCTDVAKFLNLAGSA